MKPKRVADVEDTDTVPTPFPGQITIVDLAKCLRVTRGNALRYAVVSRGELVNAGDILAKRKMLGPLWARKCVAPVTGRVTDLTDGMVFIRETAPATRQEAHSEESNTGTEPVPMTDSDATVAVIQGVWGAGGSARAPLHLLVSGPSERINWQKVGVW